MAVFFRDITEKRKLEEELLRTSQTLQAAMDNSAAGIVIADAPDGKLRYINDAGLLICGGNRQSPPDGVGIDVYVASWDLLDLEGVPLKADELLLTRAIEFGETGSREVIIRRSDGDERTVVANAAPIKDGTGSVASAIVVFTDITERVSAEKAMAESEAKYRRIAENINDVGGIGSQTLKFTYASPSVEKLQGFTPGEIVGSSIDLVLSVQNRQAMADLIAEILADLNSGTEQSGRVYTRELQLPRKDGSTVWTEVAAYVGINDSDRAAGAAGRQSRHQRAS